MNDIKHLSTQATNGSFTNESDLNTLSLAFSLQHIDYIDIGQQEQFIAAIQRWPLLSELMQDQGV